MFISAEDFRIYVLLGTFSKNVLARETELSFLF